MAEPLDTLNPEEIKKASEESVAMLERLGDIAQSTSTKIEFLKNLMAKGVEIKDLKGTIQGLNKFSKGAKSAGSEIENFFKSMSVGADPLGEMLKSASPEKVKEILADSMLTASSMINDAFESMQSMAKNTTQAIAAIGTLGLAKARVEAIKFLDTKTGYVDLEKQLMEIQKAALQMGVSFGESYTEASGSVGFFESSMAQTIKTLHATKEELGETRNAMKEAFASREMFDNIEGLDLGLQGVKSSVNLTNIALAVSKATGMDVSDVAGKMADMHLRLGSSLRDTALAFGSIRAIAKDSGLTYKSVSDTVIDSAKTLKFYGATVESVSPIFKAFNSSLKGIGKEGLTPELLKDFVSGLQSMQLNTRALLGLSMPGAGAGSGGILGGGLRVERAMETGEGMGDVIQSLSETMKKFGGPRLLTREEAIESPALERNFIIQRQILGQLTGIKDSGKQNQMMQILQDMDKHGLEASTGAKDKLGELMAAGEKTADETTDALTKAQQQYQRTRIGQGTQIIEHLKTLASDAGLRQLLKSSDKVIDTLTTSIGDINFEAASATLDKLREEQSELKTKLGGEDLTKKERKVTEKQLTRNISKETQIGVGADYQRAILDLVKKSAPETRQKFINTGKATGETQTKAWKQAQKNATDKLERLSERLKSSDIGKQEAKSIIVEKRVIKQALANLKDSLMSQKADKPGRGATKAEREREVLKYDMRKKERDRLVGGATEASYFSEEARRARATPVDTTTSYNEEAATPVDTTTSYNEEARRARATPVDTTTSYNEEAKRAKATPVDATTSYNEEAKRAKATPVDATASYFSEEARRARATPDTAPAKTGLAPVAAPRPAPSAMREIIATPVTAPQEITGTITVKLEVDREGRLVTTDQVVEIVDGRIDRKSKGIAEDGQ